MKSLQICIFTWISINCFINIDSQDFCNPNNQIIIDSPIPFAEKICHNTWKTGFIASFNVSSGLLLQLRSVSVIDGFDNQQPPPTFHVYGEWNGSPFQLTFIGSVFDVWSQGGNVSLTTNVGTVISVEIEYSACTLTFSVDTSDNDNFGSQTLRMKNIQRPVGVDCLIFRYLKPMSTNFEASQDSNFFVDYCASNVPIEDNCDESINQVIAFAPPGINCSWQLALNSLDLEWEIFMFGLNKTTSVTQSNAPSISLIDSNSDCILGEYVLTNSKVDDGTLLSTKTNQVNVVFKSPKTGNEFCTYTGYPSVLFDFKSKNALCKYCFWLNSSENVCGENFRPIKSNRASKSAIESKRECVYDEANFDAQTWHSNNVNLMLPNQECGCINNDNIFADNCGHTSSFLSTGKTESSISTVSFKTAPVTPVSSVVASQSSTRSMKMSTTSSSTNYSYKSSSDVHQSSTEHQTTPKLITTDSYINTESSPTVLTSVSQQITVSTSSSSHVLASSTIGDTTSLLQTTTAFFPDTLEGLMAINVTECNVEQTLRALLTILTDTPASEINSTFISGVTDVLVKSADVNPLAKQDCDLWMQNINLLLAANYSAFSEAQLGDNSCNQLLNSLDMVASNADVNQATNFTYFSNGTFLSLSVSVNNCSQNIYTNGIYQLTNGTVGVISDFSEVSSDDTRLYMSLPQNLICMKNGTRVAFKIFDTVKLFVNNSVQNETDSFLKWFWNVVDLGSTENQTNSWCQQNTMPYSDSVVSGTVMVPPVSVLSQPATIVMRIPPRKFTRQQLSCGFWNNITNNWEQSGCNEIGTTTDGRIIFQTNHLTDFALLVTVQATDPMLCDNFLNTFGFVTSIVSTISLGLVLLLQIYYMGIAYANGKPLAKYVQSVCFNGTFFAFFLVFTVASDQARVPMTLANCQINGAIMYTLLMSAMFWTLCRSVQFYKLYVLVFEATNVAFRAISSEIAAVSICTLIPSIATIILWYAGDNLFRRTDQFCWVTADLTLYGVVIPMSVLLLVNFAISVCVAKSLFHVTLTRDRSTQIFQPKNKRSLFWRKIWIILAMQIILCMPWIMQYFTFINIDLNVFHYIFTIFNGLQGLWIALIYVYESKSKLKKFKSLKTVRTLLSFKLKKKSHANISTAEQTLNSFKTD